MLSVVSVAWPDIPLESYFYDTPSLRFQSPDLTQQLNLWSWTAEFDCYEEAMLHFADVSSPVAEKVREGEQNL